MRQGHSSKRSRGRSGGRRNGSPRQNSFDSNGPSIRIRGNAHQVYEKYIQLARDANVAGDRITAENMYQHAEHYFRIMNVDDGDSQRQNRGNGVDQRQNQRNGQDGSALAPDGGQGGEQPTQSGESAGLNGSGEKQDDGTGEAAKQNIEAAENSDEPRRERPARRSRRSTSRQRSEAAATETADTESVEQAADVEPESAADSAAADSAEADVNEVH